MQNVRKFEFSILCPHIGFRFFKQYFTCFVSCHHIFSSNWFKKTIWPKNDFVDRLKKQKCDMCNHLSKLTPTLHFFVAINTWQRMDAQHLALSVRLGRFKSNQIRPNGQICSALVDLIKNANHMSKIHAPTNNKKHQKNKRPQQQRTTNIEQQTGCNKIQSPLIGRNNSNQPATTNK